MDSCSVRSHSQTQRPFNETDVFTENLKLMKRMASLHTSKLVSNSVLGVFANMLHWLVNCIILYEPMRTHAKKNMRVQTHAKKMFWVEIYVEVTQSREKTFCVQYVNAFIFANFRGAIARFARSWLRPWSRSKTFYNLCLINQYAIIIRQLCHQKNAIFLAWFVLPSIQELGFTVLCQRGNKLWTTNSVD